jgi:spore coat polysaccharide biosynthesis protein SpsF
VRVVAIVQARMGSSRLPGKVLKKVLDSPLLHYQLERLKLSKRLDYVVVATSNRPEDDAIENFCRDTKTHYYRGSEDDVLQRYFESAKHFGADVIVRLTGDCPLIDPLVVDDLINNYVEEFPKYDYLSNCLERTFPRGMDTEIFSFECLDRVYRQAVKDWDKEHVTPYIYQHPKLFSIKSVTQETDQSDYRWTVDTSEDFSLIDKIITSLYPENPYFSQKDIVDLLEENPSWQQMNAHVKQKMPPKKNIDKVSFEKVSNNAKDLKLIYDWRSDPFTLEMSYHQKISPWEVFQREAVDKYLSKTRHVAFFASFKSKKIAFVHAEPLLSEKADLAKCCKISINLSPKFRGQGLSNYVLKSFEPYLREKGFETAYAEIKVKNKISQRAFLKAGYHFLTRQSKYIEDLNKTFPIQSYVKNLC